MSVLFSGGIATYASVRSYSDSVVLIIFEDVYGCSGLDDMLLNHNHYIKAKNVCSVQCPILYVTSGQ